MQECQTGLHRAPPELWPQLGGEEFRGPSFAAASAGVVYTVAVSAGMADSAAVKAVTAPPFPAVQQPLHWIGKRFRDRFAKIICTLHKLIRTYITKFSGN